MEHFPTENWSDLVKQTAGVHEKSLMQQHLNQGCKRCKETVSLWQRVGQYAALEAIYQPQLDAVRIAKATFAGAGLAVQRKGAGRPLQDLFDKFLQPFFQGS